MASKYLTQDEFNGFKDELFKRLDETHGEDRRYFEELIDKNFAEQLKNILTKDEFFDAMAKLMKELQASREEQTVLAYRSSNHGDRIERVEKHLNLPAID